LGDDGIMERLLMAVDTVNQAAGGQSLLGTIKIAVLPIAKVFTMCFLGFLMASKYVNILPANGRKLLNGVCMPGIAIPTPFTSNALILMLAFISTLFHIFFVNCITANIYLLPKYM
jgi:hypothetical protein